MKQDIKAIVLAAGKGKRLQSEEFDAPKVLRKANGRPLIGYVLDNIDFVSQKDTVVVVGYKGDMVRKALGENYSYAVQAEQKGTGHATAMAAPLMKGYTGNVLVTYGDMPLFSKETYMALVNAHGKSDADATILTATTAEPLAYGRIIRDENEKVIDIIEEKDCTPEQKAIQELNVGVYVFRASVLFENLHELKNENAQGEYYLTDIAKILIAKGMKVESYQIFDSTQILGVNTQEDLALCEKILKDRRGDIS